MNPICAPTCRDLAPRLSAANALSHAGFTRGRTLGLTLGLLLISP